KKIILVFQPHMFSRTKALFNDFVRVLKHSPANKTYILDIFPSREVDTGLVNTQQLVDAINQKNVQYINSYDKLLDLLPKEIKEDNLVIFMGAGDNHKLAKELVNGK
ncbi:MAG: UDP-N-acetylmuramate--L-alanine ligase, partial [Candidatus Daviesbacteria bacterium]|nr:UDP-N-acetylmuramate--L-alanine ligase [Candidatus Daviesbacteria bacterium]